MKKLFMATTVIACLIPIYSYAHPPFDLDVTFICPLTTGEASRILTNFGCDGIKGNGLETVGCSGEVLTPEFEGSPTAGQNIPLNLLNGGYVNSGTSYAAGSGVVTCYYKSTTGFDPFSVGYKMVNGTGGFVKSSGDNSIIVSLAVGANKIKA